MDGLVGLLLAGGFASRFGSDKSLFVPFPGSGDMLHRGLSLLASLPEVRTRAVSCRADQAEALKLRLPEGAEIVIDQPHEQASPIFGLAAAMKKWRQPILVLSCDLPLMDAALLRELCAARPRTMTRPASPLRTAFCHADGRVETLVSIWEPGSLPFLERAMESGRLGLYSAIPPERQMLVPVRDPRPFFNMNTREDALRLGALTGQ